MNFTEGTFWGWGGQSTGWAGQSENVKRLDRKSQAQMAEGFQKPKNQLAYDAASIRQVSYLISFRLVQPISTTCMSRKDVDEVSDATEMIFRTERHRELHVYVCYLYSYISSIRLSETKEKYFAFRSNLAFIVRSSCFISLNFISC